MPYINGNVDSVEQQYIMLSEGLGLASVDQHVYWCKSTLLKLADVVDVFLLPSSPTSP
ncbi:6003_t:CDS:2 [Rhizophagus irregularis]|nr:6003_t:CDS:2 [Rhizophagus irregularis]